MLCPFCHIDDNKILWYGNKVRLIESKYPVFKKHYLIVTEEHFTDIVDLQHRDPDILVYIFSNIEKIASVVGMQEFKLITNRGATASQSVFHVHIHLVCGVLRNPSNVTMV